MTITTMDCVECGESVAYGRLSCPSCGALLASVTGARRRAVRTPIIAPTEPESLESKDTVERVPTAEPPPPLQRGREMTPPAASVDPAPTPGTVRPAAQGRRPNATRQEMTPVAKTPAASAGPPMVAARSAAAQAIVTAAPAQAVPAKPASVAPTPSARSAAPAPPARSDPTSPAAPIPTPPEVDPATAMIAVRPVGAPSVTPPYMKRGKPPGPAGSTVRPAVIPLLEPSDIATPQATPWTPLVEPPAVLVGRPYLRHLAPDPEDDSDPAPPPSAYRRPTMGLATTGAAVAAGAGAGFGSGLATDRAEGDPPAADPVPATRPILDAARFTEIGGWFVIVGATMSVLGLLLPWSRIVIGSGGAGGYFDTWGLAGPTHLLVFMSLLGVLALAVLRTRVPAWIWSTVVSVGLGGLLIGLTWPYVFGPLGSQVGVTVTALGGIALLIGGGVSTWASRHQVTNPRV